MIFWWEASRKRREVVVQSQEVNTCVRAKNWKNPWSLAWVGMSNIVLQFFVHMYEHFVCWGLEFVCLFLCSEGHGYGLLHRMQIWRTTRLAPRTSRMIVRLVRLWCFVLEMLPQKSLALSSIWSILFHPPTHFCVPEYHQKKWNLLQQRKRFFFFSFPIRLWKRRGQVVHDCLVKELFKFRLKDLRKCVSDRI